MLRFLFISVALGLLALLAAKSSFLMALAVLYCVGMVAVVVYSLKIHQRNHAMAGERKLALARKKLQEKSNVDANDVKAA